MDIYYDLHMHSCLSPCGDDEMTPWNLVGMAKLKGLQVIALTDHNCALNLPQAVAAGKTYGVEVLLGMEISTKEDVHMLGYFPTLDAALDAGKAVYEHLPAVMNDPTLFGNQLIVGEDDEPTGTVDKLLINATKLGVDEVCALIADHGGIAVPAHINRGSNGMIGALGLMPMLPEYPVVEVYPGVVCPAYATKGRFQLHSSDAHQLEAIHEASFTLDADAATAEAVFAALKKRCGG